MELTTREDIDAPQDWVWQRVTDHTAFERLALRRGAEVTRQTSGTGFEQGEVWLVDFRFRGRERQLEAKLEEVRPPESWVAQVESGGIEGTMRVELIALSRSRTRMIVETRLGARTLSARLMLQSFKLARSGMLRKFRARVARYAQDMEERYRREG